jgi:hypothetical protein
MASVEFVTVEEMLPRRALRQSQRRKVQEEYEAYIAALVPGQAGKVTLEKGEKMSMVRDRLRSAASRLGRPVQLRRKGGALYFRLKDGDVDAAQVAEPDDTADDDVEAPAAKSGRRRRSSE